MDFFLVDQILHFSRQKPATRAIATSLNLASSACFAFPAEHGLLQFPPRGCTPAPK
jgi:hypothetical protein